MVDKTVSTKDESRATDVYDTVRENMTRTIDEYAKRQPQYLQSISNLQEEYIQTTRNLIQTTLSAQKQIVDTFRVPTTSAPYADLVTRQSNEITDNAIRSLDINKNLLINTLDAARENLKNYNRTVNALTDFSTNVAKAWTNFYSQQQQQFTRQ
jgi:hypothetical protein